MSEKSQTQDGLLLLLKAAEAVGNDEEWDHPYSRAQMEYHASKNHSIRSHSSNSYLHYVNQRKSQTHTRCTHNELEKSRRAHLRGCMDGLKQRLNFDDDSVTRITMLTILKKATSTIIGLRQENHSWESREAVEKKRCNHLLLRRQTLRKRLEAQQRRNKQLAKFQSWRERNRNVSECSVATTSSEDSELDFAFPVGNTFLHGGRVGQGLKTGSPTGGLSGEDCGSDSGYESPKLLRPGVQISGIMGSPIAASLDKLSVRERIPVLSGGCNGC